TFPDGDVRVVVSLVEGRQIKIDRIRFKGNKGLTESELKDALATRERQYFILRGKVQRQRLDEDVERIIQLYNDHGYIQARVESTDVVVDREKALVTVTFTVVEGPQFKVGAIKLTGITLLPEPGPTPTEAQDRGRVLAVNAPGEPEGHREPLQHHRPRIGGRRSQDGAGTRREHV